MGYVINDSQTYNKVLQIYDENKHKPPMQWLTLTKIFSSGKQGVAGLFKVKGHGYPIVFKFSLYIDYLAEHEDNITKDLNKLSPFCPHFGRSIGTIVCKLDPRRSGNPFITKAKYPIEKRVILYEFIDDSYKLYNHVRNTKMPEEVVFSTIKQVLMAVSISQKKLNFVHYDLHSNNIMMKRCDKDIVFLYVLDSKTQYCIASNGKYPVVIDFGFSYTNESLNKPAWASLSNSQLGFTSCLYDDKADIKLFLKTTMRDLETNGYESKRAKKLYRVVNNMFANLNIQDSNGWDNNDKTSVTMFVSEMMTGYSRASYLFTRHDIYCLEIIQTLITLPLKKQSYNGVEQSYVAFLTEWNKIEIEINSPFYSMYLLKEMVDSASKLKDMYKVADTQKEAVNLFSRSVHDSLSKITSFCQPKNVNFEILLCSLYLYSKAVEGIYFELLTKKMNKKIKRYSKMPIQNVDECYEAIETHIPCTYKYSDQTSIIVLDTERETQSAFTLNEDTIVEINKLDSFDKAKLLYKLYQTE